MATSAKVTYCATEIAGVFNYQVLLKNTSPAPFDIYAWMFGAQYNVQLINPFPLQNIAFISSPPGWLPSLSPFYINWFTNFQGNPIASGYILPGQVGKFAFQSSTAPPKQIPFGCCFYNNANAWGFPFNGSADLVDCNLMPVTPPVYNPPGWFGTPWGLVPLPVTPPIFNPWWWFETRGGLVPPGPPPPWLEQFVAALTFAGIASRTSPQLRAGVLELALDQISSASAAIKKDIKALQKK